MLNLSNTKPFGFIVLDKPSGLTSHDCIQRLRKIFRIKRIGHAGTLDPDVTGVLPIAIGNATRLIPYLRGSKTYVGSFQLGKNTSTDDISGETISVKKWPELNSSDLNNYLNHFRGSIKQKPPQVSSININGERAYKRFRKGEVMNIPSREIEVYKLNLIKWDQILGVIKVEIDCSSGTYIRSIARDLGELIGCGGCLLKLRRVQALGFTVEQAIELPKITTETDQIKPLLLEPSEAIRHLQYIDLESEEELNYWRTGRSLNISNNRIKSHTLSKSCQDIFPDKSYIAINKNGILIGIGEYDNFSKLQPKAVFNPKQ